MFLSGASKDILQRSAKSKYQSSSSKSSAELLKLMEVVVSNHATVDLGAACPRSSCVLLRYRLDPAARFCARYCAGISTHVSCFSFQFLMSSTHALGVSYVLVFLCISLIDTPDSGSGL